MYISELGPKSTSWYHRSDCGIYFSIFLSNQSMLVEENSVI